MIRRKQQIPSPARSGGLSHQSTGFELVEDMEYHYQIGEGIQKNLMIFK